MPIGTLVVGVADGAGSAILGEAGAAVAVQTAVEAICTPGILPAVSTDDAGWASFLIDALEAVRKAIEAEAVARGVRLSDLATTMIVAIATPEIVAVAQVGDGAAVAGDREGNIVPLTVPQSGEYINETTFITASNALDTAQIIVRREATSHLALFSDGLQMLALKMPSRVPHVPFFSPLFHFVANTTDDEEAQAQLLAFLRSPRIRERTDDDLTLLLAALVV